MAERRMFAKSIVLSDAFLDMPMSARCLYFTLGMLADDDGFVGSPKSIMRQCGASDDDMNILLAKRYVLGFDSGIIVIKHWRMNNYLRNDRYTQTTYIEEKDTLILDEKGAYTEKNKSGIPTVYQLDTQDSIGKYSIGNYEEDNIKNAWDVAFMLERYRQANYDEQAIKDTINVFERFQIAITTNLFPKILDVIENKEIINKEGYCYEVFKREGLI